MAQNGRVVQVLGPVVDVEFPPGELPELMTALRLTNPGISDSENNLVLEVATHLGENTVRCVAMDTTEGLTRGQDVVNTGDVIRIPVGPKTLGRIMNVIGEPVDERGPIASVPGFVFCFHCHAPSTVLPEAGAAIAAALSRRCGARPNKVPQMSGLP